MRRPRRDRSTPEVEHTDADWRERLDPEAYRVLRRAGTEPPGSSAYEHPPVDGPDQPDDERAYRCAGCDAELFRVAEQYDSRSGWPSFTAPAGPDAVATAIDFSMILPRREAHCARCGGHLGHVFRDGPAPTGQRWCINGAALSLDDPDPDPDPDAG